MTGHEEEPKNFAPKVPVQLDPPKYDPISYEDLSKCDGMCANWLASRQAGRQASRQAGKKARLTCHRHRSEPSDVGCDQGNCL